MNKISKKNPAVVILLGKSGSGKGTQAELLKKKFGLDYIGSGDLLRGRMKEDDFTGKKVAKVMREGGLHPTAIIFKLWLDKVERIKRRGDFKGLIMDGNPRKLLEAYLIDGALDWYEWNKNVKVFLVDISNKEAITRLTTRRICKDCKEILPFIGEYKNMKECPKCKGELIKRIDDTVSSAKNRLKWFKTDVQPVINYYRKTGRLIKINGEQSIEGVSRDILKFVK